MDEYDYISDYFDSKLSSEEMKKFDRKVIEDPAFAEEVAFYCSAVQEIKKQAGVEKKKAFREIYELQGLDKNNRPPLVFMNKWWKAAVAATAVIFIAGAMFLFSRPSAQSMADGYVKDNFSSLHVTMGRNDSLQTAAALYNDGKLKESLAIFEQLAAADSAQAPAIKNAGIVCLQLKEYDKALAYFNRLQKMDLYANPGAFYQAITFLQRNQAGDKEQAKQLLQQVVEKDLEGRETAEKLLQKL